jgi:hypothetical protein
MPWIMLPLALLATDNSISLTSTGLDRVGQLVCDAPQWADAISLYAKHMQDQGVAGIAEKAQQNSLTFRASIVRDGAHTWKSTDAMARIGETVSESRGWGVKMKEFDCEIMGIVLHDKVDNTITYCVLLLDSVQYQLVCHHYTS